MASDDRGKSVIIFDDVAKRNLEIRTIVKNIPGFDKNQEHLLAMDASNPGEHI